MELLVIVLLVLINGVFSMSEIALVSSRKSKLETAARNGDRQAEHALALANSPNRFLSTVQIGITLIGILNGVFSGERITNDFQAFIEQYEPLKPYAHTIAVGGVVLFVTYLSLVLGELVPKRIGMSNPEGIAKFMATPMNWLSNLTAPFIWLLAKSSDLIMKVLRIKQQNQAITEEEIKTIIQEGTTGGVIDEIEQEIVENVFHLGDRKITSLMTNRQEVVWLDTADTIEENKRRILEFRHSVYPLCHDSIDNVVGLVYVKDLLENSLDDEIANLESYKREALYIAENNKAYEVLQKFKEKRVHFGIIVDEYGSLQGIATLNDILDALVGDLSETNEFNYDIVEREDGSFLVDAQLPWEDFLEHFEITVENKVDLTGFNTLGGFALHILKDIPNTGEHFKWQEYRFEIIDMDKSRIDKILVSKLEEAQDND
ncbi:hemolysin family protein [Runella zeae]|uniref:hemolysin family protein n=1 Tax=Runella zeae TaxID=94255 RepID=UPI0021CEE5CB|nr:hemolysin family protein [Runella zeae]